ncbi:alanine racemase [Paenibacillus thermotolerans]|uniref:alanine racemase n=1 Tax=Paenibacillus thermotolerans TaxID=3027807 RepID=UPI002368C3CA|nr:MULTISPECIES: alanine racemase [unclassified Paenibacillus]
MDSYRMTRAEVDLDALRHNLGEFRRALGPDIRLMAVVKANAYGHGAVKVAEEALDFGVTYLAVAFLDEALELRRHGIGAPLLVLGYTPPEAADVAREHDVTLTVFDRSMLRAAAESYAASAEAGPLRVHVKIDTGMGRIGIPDEREACEFIEEALDTKGVLVEGLFTHYAAADEADKSYTRSQHDKFERVVAHFRGKGVTFPYLHAGNSATGIDTPEWTYNMLRLGIGMYGLYPSQEVNRERVSLRPVMSLKTGVVMVKELPPGSGISYGVNYVTRGRERIATLPIGYADGYTRLLNGKADVLVHGNRAPVVGNICMDQCMVRLDGAAADEVSVGDEVVLFGRQGAESITADELAEKLGTINYEITCMLSHRVPRVYVKDGKTVLFDNPLVQK